jgi:hypothetical protein
MLIMLSLLFIRHNTKTPCGVSSAENTVSHYERKEPNVGSCNWLFITYINLKKTVVNASVFSGCNIFQSLPGCYLTN